MKNRKLLFFVLNLVLCFALLFSQYAGAAIFAFETQGEYDKADIAWLTDLVIKEDMESTAGLAEKVTLLARPDNAYSTTPDAFKQEVEKYCELFTLTENAPRVGYIYLFEFMNANASLFSGQVTDDAVVRYLENRGIVMPGTMDADDYVLARALYAAMSTGSLSGISSEELGTGVAFEKALLRYLVSFSGMSEEELLKWAPASGITSFDDYVLAASRLTLWSSGFDISPDASEGETYRLMAVLTLKKMGVNVGTDASFNELKAKYTAALLGRQYGVSVEADKLTVARARGTAAFYLLQLIGKKAGLSVKGDMTYEEAFDLVAKNSGSFAIEDGEWYADIYKYDAVLKEKRDTLWIYPTSYLTGQENADVSITVNGGAIKNGEFTAVKINPAAKEQTLNLTIYATLNGESSKCTYLITVKQGSAAAAAATAEPAAAPQSSGTIISNILATLGMDASVSSIVDSIYGSLPGAVKNVINFIAPTFDGGTADPAGAAAEETTTAAVPGEAAPAPAPAPAPADPAAPIIEQLKDSFFVSMLDKVGAVIDFVIYGVDGVDLSSRFQSQSRGHNFITFR